MKRIRDWKRIYFQLSILCAVILLNIFVNFPELIIRLINGAAVYLSDLPWFLRVIIGFGRLGFAVFTIATVYYYLIWKPNLDKCLRQNISDLSVWHSYFGYWVCRYVFNYQTISLTRVPIPVQFQLVWKGIFEKYEYMENVTEKTDDDSVSVEMIQTDPYTSTVNLILCDTYRLDNWQELIPASATSLSTIVIQRNDVEGVRYYSKEFITTIMKIFRSLPATVTDINVFATVNTAHVYHLVNEVLKTGRNKLNIVTVYQQTSNWDFNGKKTTIKIGG